MNRSKFRIQSFFFLVISALTFIFFHNCTTRSFEIKEQTAFPTASPHLSTSPEVGEDSPTPSPNTTGEVLQNADRSKYPLGINDTGQTLCDEGDNLLVQCDITAPSQFQGQDAVYGRDALIPPKKGGGPVGFDFTRVCMNGKGLKESEVCDASPDTSANPSSEAWACTKDNQTKLIWSLETKRWISSYNSKNENRCGLSSDWRLPTRRELLTIVHNGRSHPAISTEYFPNTEASAYWTSEPHAVVRRSVWYVNFDSCNAIVGSSATEFNLRLIHDGK